MSFEIETNHGLAVAEHLSSVSASLDEHARTLAGITWLPPQAVLHVSTLEFAAGAAYAHVIAPSLLVYSAQLTVAAQGLQLAVSMYLAAEATVEAAMRSAQAMAAWLAGKALAFLLLTVPGQIITITLIGSTLAGISIAQAIATLYFGRQGRPAPNLVDEALESINWQPLIRAGVDAAGHAPFGGLPPGLYELLDLKGAEGTAAIAYLLAVQLGLIAPGVFTVTELRTTHLRDDGTPPTLGSLIDDIPPSDDGGPQVAVTTYSNAEGDHRYAIAITGTSSQAFGSGDQPFDNQGNGGTYGGFDAESVAAVLAAIEAAGVPEGATIVLSGYSQGAMVAQAIAASGRFDVELLTTIGTPSRPDGVPASTTIVEIEHSADPIVGLQGTRPEHNDGATIVTCDPVVDPSAPPPGGAMSNHALDAYAASADALDTSADPAVQAAQAELAEIFDGYVATDVQHITVERNEVQEPVPGSLPWIVDGACGPAYEAAEKTVEVAQAALGKG